MKLEDFRIQLRAIELGAMETREPLLSSLTLLSPEKKKKKHGHRSRNVNGTSKWTGEANLSLPVPLPGGMHPGGKTYGCPWSLALGQPHPHIGHPGTSTWEP